MNRFVLIALLVVASCGSLDSFQSSLINKKEDIKSQYTVTNLDALESLAQANRSGSFAYAISKQSVAQVVFPKIVKAGLLVGANYGEGFLIRDGEVVALIDLTGGNLGFQAGAQTYSQVTYILSEQRYLELLTANRMSLNGSISMAVSGKIQNSILTTDAIKGDLYTLRFNTTGTVYGASLEGLYYSVRKSQT